VRAKNLGILGLFGLTAGLFIVPEQAALAVSPDVVISQVYGGGGNSGAPFTHDFIELYNRGASPVSLAGWSVQYASATGTGNLGSSATQLSELAGTIGPGEYLLVQEASTAAVGAPLPTPAIVDPTPIAMGATGGKVALVTDAATLGCNGSSTPCGAPQVARIKDLVGYGNANYFEGAGATPAPSNTLAAVRLGAGATDTDNNNADFVAAAPDPRNTVAPPTEPPPADIVVSEVYGGGGNSGATLTNDYIELFNRSAAAVSLDGWSVQYTNATGSSWAPTPLTGTIAAGRYYLVQEAAGGGGTTPLPTPDATGTSAMAATAGKVALVRSTTPLTCASACPAVTTVQDFVGYGTTADDFEGSGPAAAPSNTTATLRNNDGATDTNNNAADFTAGDPDPHNTAFVPPPPPGTGCATPATHEIAAVQGAGTATPIPNQVVRVEGVVTGDFQAAGQLGGIFIQDDTPDSDPATSDGLFVFTTLPAALGDRVLANGRVVEFSGLTELTQVTTVDVCGTGAIAAQGYDLPRPSGTTFEAVEGVLVTFPETLTATEHFQLGRFGEVTVASDGRLLQPTDRVDPGAPAQAALDLAARRRLLVDDGSNVQNPPVVPFVTPGNALRLGDTATGITGVLSFGFGQYRLEPTAPITFARTNPRPAAPADVGGDLKVASFNTLNYFTTLRSTNPNARGADNATEFGRQQAKEVAAITGLGADVLGLMEVENNGVGPSSAIASLVDALNVSAGAGTYAYVTTEPVLNAPNEFGGEFGTDAIKVALVYKPAVVTPVGAAQSSGDPIFNRPPLIQTFQRVAGGEVVTVVVNHYKSKGCDGASGLDLDQGDGQSCFNARRVAQSQTLVSVLDALDPPNTLIIGDLNSYTEEDPIRTLEAAGYSGLSELHVPDADRYSFVFDGFSGELDHGLASPELLDNVSGAAIWHINADEPLILDYNTEFNPPGLYAPDAYRSSDHDPVVIGLNLAIHGPSVQR
jgi:hypothetical protein